MSTASQKAWLAGAPLIIGDLTFQVSRDEGARIAIRCPPILNDLCDQLAALMAEHLKPVADTVFLPFLELIPDGYHTICQIPIIVRMMDDGDLGWGIGMPPDPVQMMLFSDQIMSFTEAAKVTFNDWIEAEQEAIA